MDQYGKEIYASRFHCLAQEIGETLGWLSKYKFAAVVVLFSISAFYMNGFINTEKIPLSIFSFGGFEIFMYVIVFILFFILTLLFYINIPVIVFFASNKGGGGKFVVLDKDERRNFYFSILTRLALIQGFICFCFGFLRFRGRGAMIFILKSIFWQLYWRWFRLV